MMISTRGRYALRVMIDLAENSKGQYIPMKAVAERQNISLKYLERILPALVKNGFIEGVQGKSGGYRLTKQPQDYRVGDILRLTEGDLAPVSCLECGAQPCDMAKSCRTRPVWTKLYSAINETLDGITIAELMKDNV
ncbi:MAG: Rrf2 family transcriptional regulator [Oscillospiraceae bacterium]|nr:Rrf2 family transcriptional regulator [Oscillospiraceae bacterium]